MGKIEVQRFEVYTQDKSVPVLVTRTADGHWYCAHDIAPLLAELATLRERTRMRARDDDSHGGKLVLVQHVPYASDEIVFSVGRMQSFGWSYVQGWWPLPQTEEK